MLHIQRGLTAIIGGGGKSTLLRALAEELSRDARVVVATSTKMYVPDWCPVVLSASPDDVRAALSEAPVVCAGSIHLPTGKLAEPRVAFADLVRLADYVLVEADGSRQLPLKAHGPQEPVIPTASRRTICVAGASGFGRPIREAVHRPERFCTLTGAAETAPATPELAARALLAEHLCDTVFLNQLDRPEQLPAARSFAAVLSAHGIRVWGGSLRSGSIFPLE